MKKDNYCITAVCKRINDGPVFFWLWQNVPTMLCHIRECFFAYVSTGPHRYNPICLQCLSYLCESF